MFVDASLAASRDPVTHVNINGMKRPKQKETKDKEFNDTVEATYGPMHKKNVKEPNVNEAKAEEAKTSAAELDD